MIRRDRGIDRMTAVAPLMLLLCLGFACSGGGTDAPPAPTAEIPQTGGTLVIGTGFDVDSWNRYLAQRDTTVRWLRRIYLPLAQEVSPELAGAAAYAPSLAESWEFSDDGTSIAFTLRETRWSDGEPVDAQDVIYTWKAQTDPDSAWTDAQSKSRVLSVEADPSDPRRVIFRFDSAYPFQFADAVEGEILPEHVFSKVPVAEWTTHDWSVYQVASGPFFLQRYAPGNEIVLDRNPNYYRQGFPYLDRIVIRIVSEPSVLLTQLRTGEVDFVAKLSPRDARRLQEDDTVHVVPFDSANFDFIGWNADHEPFDKIEIRRALTMAMDRQALVDELLFGFGEISVSPVPSFWYLANAQLQPPLPRDVDSARKILEAAGYRGRPDGPGKPLRFELVTNSGNSLREDVATKVQGQLAELGIEVAIGTPESGALNQKLIEGNFDAFVRGLSLSGRPPLGLLFSSESIPPKNGFNVIRYRSAEADRLLRDIDTATDWEGVKRALDAVQEQIHNDQPMTLLYQKQGLAAHGPQVGGVRIDVPSDPMARLEEFWRR